MKNSFRSIIIVLVFYFTGIVGAISQSHNNFEISKSLDIYATVLRELNLNYVDDIRAGELNQIAIDAMLNSLDPYTVFVPESQIEDFQLMTTGEYGGIGSLIQQIGEHIYISEPYEGFPAHKAGLKAGDRILEVNGLDTKGKTSSEISELLKGQPGTSIQMLIEREGEPEPVNAELIRERIKIDNIPYQTVFDNDIGYIRLTGFTQKAAAEVKKVFLDMKNEKPELKGLILDLRGNGGGLLNEAVDITNLFVDRAEVVVTTKGKAMDRTVVHRTRHPITDADIPLAVLVNENSASASEIVAGALQDYDRAVIIGQRTFGKGLVQNVLPLTYNTQMKVTVAQYYIPSGRGIQAIDYKHRNINGGKIPDSLISSFRTRNNRVVYDGGGILPDIEIEKREFSQVSANLYGKNMIFHFANHYARLHDSIEEPENFKITDEVFDDFKRFTAEKGFDYITESEDAINRLRSIAEEETYLKAIEPQIMLLEDRLKEYKANDFEKYRNEIEEMLLIEIVSRYYFQKGKIIASLRNDHELEKAFEVLIDAGQYHDLLSKTTH